MAVKAPAMASLALVISSGELWSPGPLSCSCDFVSHGPSCQYVDDCAYKLLLKLCDCVLNPLMQRWEDLVCLCKCLFLPDIQLAFRSLKTSITNLLLQFIFVAVVLLQLGDAGFLLSDFFVIAGFFFDESVDRRYGNGQL